MPEKAGIFVLKTNTPALSLPRFDMKLYDVPRNSYVQILEPTTVPPGGIVPRQAEIFIFSKIDGMYSLCVNVAGDIVHLAAWTDVVVVTRKEFDAQSRSST